jgi:NMD protein affecting ribosome stability and mRNA decay
MTLRIVRIPVLCVKKAHSNMANTTNGENVSVCQPCMLVWMPKPNVIDPAILEAALINLETRRTHIDDQIATVRSMLDGGSPSAKPNAKRRRKKYRMSAEGRARIIAASRKRWAAVKKAARAKKAS